MNAAKAKEISDKYCVVDKKSLEVIDKQIIESAEKGYYCLCITTPYTNNKHNEGLILKYFTDLGFTTTIENLKDCIRLTLEW